MKMSITYQKRLLVGTVLMLALFIASGSAWGASKMLRFQVNYLGTSYGGTSMKHFAKEVAKESGGQLEVKLFFEGEILKTKEAFSAMQKGLVDGLYSALLYYGGVVKEASWEWLPFTWESAQQVEDLYMNHGLLALMQEALAQHDVRYLTAIPMGTLGFLTKFPVTKMSDFEGKKLRASGPQASTVKLLGAAPVALSAPEQYTSLQRGTIDGTIYPWYTIGAYKFYEVIDYIVLPGVYSPCVIDLTMNMKSWESLSKEMQEAVTRAALNTMRWTAKANEKWDQEGLQIAKEKNVKITSLSASEFAKFKEATRPMWKDVAARSELSAKAVKIVEDYMKDK